MKLDLKTIEMAISSGLPVRARWIIDGTPLDFDFSLGGQGLRSLPFHSDEKASDLLVFGERDFAEGGGARV